MTGLEIPAFASAAYKYVGDRIEPSIQMARREGVSLARYLLTQLEQAPHDATRENLAFMFGVSVVRWLELDHIQSDELS